MWLGRAGLVGVVVVTLTSCAVDQHRPYFHDDERAPEISAARLGDPMDDDSVADMLEPEEREAVRRSGMTGIRLDEPDALDAPPPPPKSGFARTMDAIGKIGVSILGVAVTVGMAIAPFLLF